MALRVVKGLSRKDLFKMALEYDQISQQIKALDSTKKSLATKIKELSEKFGNKDSKGSSYCSDEDYICGNVAKHTVSLNTDKAVALLQSKNLNSYITEKIVKVVDEKKLEKAVALGTITQKEFKSIMDDKVSYSVLVKRAEEMPEVEQTSFKVAKIKK